MTFLPKVPEPSETGTEKYLFESAQRESAGMQGQPGFIAAAPFAKWAYLAAEFVKFESQVKPPTDDEVTAYYERTRPLPGQRIPRFAVRRRCPGDASNRNIAPELPRWTAGIGLRGQTRCVAPTPASACRRPGTSSSRCATRSRPRASSRSASPARTPRVSPPRRRRGSLPDDRSQECAGQGPLRRLGQAQRGHPADGAAEAAEDLLGTPSRTSPESTTRP